ncbi:hypothetical protein POVWA2_059760 [Plasmodium ovale wallikeri]|uniref:ADF-H domain-containing protein n=1 Tax=Plasmodium ovale wallikeri TaxID=864142 RepID=A0A1A9A1J1_PLAOA|nr:hypothetical protein POVWA2_059760 [Plasmodium ovale wallikeri]
MFYSYEAKNEKKLKSVGAKGNIVVQQPEEQQKMFYNFSKLEIYFHLPVIQFMLSGYAEQGESLQDDIDNLRHLLNNELCFIMYNISKFTPKCKWIIVLWAPDDVKTIEMRKKEEKLKKKNNYVKIFEKEKKYNSVCNLNKLIYRNLKYTLLNIVDDNDVLYFEISNFDELVKCISDIPNFNGIRNSFSFRGKQMNRENISLHANVRNHLYNSYFLNDELKHCNSFIETDNVLMRHIKVITEEKSTCLNLLKIDINNYTLSSYHLVINNIESVHNITRNECIFYVLYKISDTYTFFYICNKDGCSTREKFVYSFFKPKLIEFLKKCNIDIFLSVEISKVKHVIDFIHSDLLREENKKGKGEEGKEKGEENLFERNSTKGKAVKAGGAKRDNQNTAGGRSNDGMNANSIKQLADMLGKETFDRGRNEEFVHGTMQKTCSFKPRGSNRPTIRNSSTSLSLKEKSSIEKLKSFSREREINKIDTYTNKNTGSDLLEKKTSSKTFNLNKNNTPMLEKKKTFKMNKKEKVSQNMLMSKSLTKESSNSFDLKKAYALNKQKSLNLEKKKSRPNLFKKSSSFHQKSERMDSPLG